MFIDQMYKSDTTLQTAALQAGRGLSRRFSIQHKRSTQERVMTSMKFELVR